MIAATAPSSPLTLHRPLHDGASYYLTAAAPGVTVLTVTDADDDTAAPALDRSQVRQLIEDLQLVAGLTQTASRLPLEQALIGSAQRLFERLGELGKMDPAAADRIAAAIASHLRSARPMALLAGGVL